MVPRNNTLQIQVRSAYYTLQTLGACNAYIHTTRLQVEKCARNKTYLQPPATLKKTTEHSKMLRKHFRKTSDLPWDTK